MFACKCHVKLCVTCHLCSRCGCNHDGKEVDQKISRKRGCKEPKGVEGEPKTKRVCPDHYGNRDVPNRILRSVSVPLIIPITKEKVDLRTETCMPVTNITELFQVLGMYGSLSVRKKLPAVQVRCDVNQWIDTSSDNCRMKVQVFQVYEEIIQRVAALICGPEAGQLSVYQAISHFAEKREHAVSSSSSRIEPIIQTIIN